MDDTPRNDHARLSRATLADLHPSPEGENARVHSPRNIGMIASSLQEVGAARSIVVDENNHILAGSGTYEGAAQVGMENVIVVDVEGDQLVAVRRSNLSPEDKVRLSLWDNRTQETSQWDENVLLELSHTDALDGMFHTRELDNLLDSVRSTDLDNTDEVPPSPLADSAMRAHRGDIYRIGQAGEHILMCGDASSPDDMLSALCAYNGTPISIDLFAADPPYNLGIEYSDDEREGDNIDHEAYMAFVRSWFPQWSRYFRRAIVTTGMFNFKDWIREYDPFWVAPWVKSNSMSRGYISRFLCSEMMLFFGPQPWPRHRFSEVFDHPIGEQRTSDGTNLTPLHPCPKPLSLWMDLIENYSERGDWVADPFAGSGTTLIAAHRHGRRSLCMDISPAYVDVTLSRAIAEGLPVQRITQHDQSS